MRIHHLALRTRDIERCSAFYRDVLGLEEQTRQRDPHGGVRAVWLALEGGPVLMIERAMDHEPGVPVGSMEFLALAIDGAAREGWRQRFAAHGVAIEAGTDFTWYVRDPDGRRVGVSSYPFG